MGSVTVPVARELVVVGTVVVNVSVVSESRLDEPAAIPSCTLSAGPLSTAGFALSDAPYEFRKENVMENAARVSNRSTTVAGTRPFLTS